MANKWEYVIVRSKNRKDPPIEFSHPYDPPPCQCPTCGHVRTSGSSTSVSFGTDRPTERGPVTAIELRCNGKKFSRVAVLGGGAKNIGDFESDLGVRFYNPLAY